MAPTVRPYRARILSTGTEITQGLYADSNAQGISRVLLDEGIRVIGHRAVPDDARLIREALVESFAAVDLLIMTGGLGPTEDDVNREVIADVLDRPLLRDDLAVEMIADRFANRGVELPVRNLVQADLPAGCVPLYNHWGTAPGFFVPATEGTPALMALPGPRHEWRPMLAEAIPALFDQAFPHRGRRTVTTLHVAMTPESMLNELLTDFFRDPPTGCELTILAHLGHVRLRLVAAGGDPEEARARLDAFRDEVADRVGREVIFAEGTETANLAEVVVGAYGEVGRTVALAESCTGGWIAKSLTDVAGSSGVLRAGWVTYGNEAKVRELGVEPETIERHGAVSAETARAMAVGARERAGTDVAVAVTGVAGPGGGTERTPVGTVWFAVADGNGAVALQRRFPGARDSVREFAMRQGLELLRRNLLGVDPDLLYVRKGEARKLQFS